jgi:hypothetical protein
MPPTSAEKKLLLENMLAILFLASRFSVDTLFNDVISWFPQKAR